MRRHRGGSIARIGLVGVTLFLTGCQTAPAFNVLGSYFPAWLFCLIVGIFLTFVAHVVLRRWNFGEALSPPILMYACLAAFFTFAIWLIFFRA